VIQLDLTRHCIETEIKRQYNRHLSEYFHVNEKDGSMERSISLLQHALETFDFHFLRWRYPELCGQSEAFVTLSGDENGNTILTLNKKVIYP
jgi:hypothetical protein